ncbi:tryptophanyl-tRNA synthetase [Spiroplasma mirum ATCC 29335]|uniref:Tryptophan--tRNA ligase n=1 Tax=Spiroplasma mirum ATCC 29335 TaxID=838561 RepID=W0GM28_9MOLU|nr:MULTISPECIES: tryptophan--tRNA ligase [Spiroplasma]AHF61315.1 tryptophanyl-tRNA synthetase [Spiroplasma mirum ATCC 29335]AHI58421.1 tryptophanyl-tRNA synthetase [Spiroplasma mirum ATCC 29335]AKM53368.1 tryptophanyl-tRNA synthetase [Spiroplasma atrichopogonis]
MNNKKPTILSGITATGKLTLGNYIGAMKNFIELQKDNNLIIFVANLHAITIPIDQEELRANTKTMVALYYACGLDPEKSIIFIQSDVLEHTQLGHILLCNTTIGELSRMTQFKDKSVKMKAENGTEYIPTGLLTYPALMAADILLYDADLVPVGKDQKQHIELTRNIAERMNNKYNPNLFKIPDDFIPEVGSKIMNLQEPSKKMSKSSNNPKSYIGMLDTPEEIRKKIKSAVTDSEGIIRYDVENKPGISNLLTIYAALKNITIEKAVSNLQNLDYGAFKKAVAEEIIKTLQPIQEKYHAIMNSDQIDELIAAGANKARAIAVKKLTKVKNSIGLNYKRK